jgi:hypothetical protein
MTYIITKRSPIRLIKVFEKGFSLIISIFLWLPFITFNCLKMWIHSNLSFFRTICKRTRPLREDRRTDCIGSMSIVSSRVSTNIFWLSILEIIMTQNRRFRRVRRERKKKKEKKTREGLHKCFPSHHIN